MQPPVFPVLEKSFNLRDLGGLPTEDGRVVRPGQLVRSGTLCELSPSDIDALKAYGLKGIFDLRSTNEQVAKPNPVIGEPVVPWRLPKHEHIGEPAKLVERIGVSREHTFGIVCESYAAFPYAYKDAYRGLFKTIARGQHPIIFHCAYGKDRTGIAAALLLGALGVTREAIMADFMRSNDVIDGFIARFLHDPHTAAANNIDPEIWRPAARAEPEYIDATFKSIESRHGTIARYVEEVLETDAAGVEALKEKFLVPA